MENLTLLRLNNWINVYHSEPESAPKAVIITKIDINHDPNEISIVKDFSRRNGWQFHLTSAKNCINVDEAFENLIKEALKKKYMIHAGEEDDFNDDSDYVEDDRS